MSVAPFTLSATKVGGPSRPPWPGEDDDVVCGQLLGYGDDVLEGLRATGAI